MSKSTIVLSLAVAVGLALACGGRDVASRWVTDPVEVDGDGKEWSGPDLAYVEDVRGVLGAANNDSSLYVMVRFADARMGRKIMFGGATIWWSRDGGKGREYGIRYAPLVDIRHVLEQGGNLRDMLSRSGRPGAEPPEGPLHNVVTLLEEDGETLLMGGDQGGIRAGSTYRAGLYCYEIQIPLHRGSGYRPSISLPRGGDVELCLELGGLSAEAQEMMGERVRGGGAPMGRGPGGGGMPPGGGGGRGRTGRAGRMGASGGPQEMMQKTELCCTIRLAEKPENIWGAG